MKAQVVHTRARDAQFALFRSQWKSFLLGLASACALILLIFALDDLANPGDISPGTAFAAVPPAPAGTRETAPTRAKSWAADSSATGTRPDAIH